jgi:hypothetical protein
MRVGLGKKNFGYLRTKPDFSGTPDMASERHRQPGGLSLVLKWGGCFTALVFAVGGLMLDFASPGEAYEPLSLGSWIIVASAMALGLAGVVFDRAHDRPKPPDPIEDGNSEPDDGPPARPVRFVPGKGAPVGH